MGLMDKVTRLVNSPEGRRAADGLRRRGGTTAGGTAAPGTGRAPRAGTGAGGAGGMLGKLSGMLGGRRR